MNYSIAIGSDHRGYELKKTLLEQTEFQGFTISWKDVGTYSDERTDYPLYAKKVADCVARKDVDYGILLCGTGIGASIAANRYPYIYAALVWNPDIARLAKEDDNCNILVLPADWLTLEEAQACIESWLTATFKEGRYQERLKSIDA